MEKLNGMRLGERMDKQTDGALGERMDKQTDELVASACKRYFN